MEHLIINGADLGPVQGYRQNRELSRWSFLMTAGYYIGADFSSIKSFESSGNLEIITFREAVRCPPPPRPWW